MPSQLQIQRIVAIAPHVDGARIVLKAEAVVADERTELEIAVTADLAPAMALALLATTAEARAQRDELDPALDVLAAAVVRSSSKERVRLQLLFDKGIVLPLEMNIDAGQALTNGLTEYFESPQIRLASGRNAPEP